VATKLLAQIKEHVNRGLYFDGLSVEEVRLVAPGPDGVHGRLLQRGRTTDDSEVLDRTAFGYRGLQDYDSSALSCYPTPSMSLQTSLASIHNDLCLLRHRARCFEPSLLTAVAK
jgi:hypothetical protein